MAPNIPEKPDLSADHAQKIPIGEQPPRVRVWTVVVWLLVWQGVSMWFAQELLLPAPLTVLRRLVELCPSPAFLRSVAHSSARIVCGFSLGCLAGMVFAIPACVCPAVRDLCYPLVTAVKSIPVASFVILSLVWLNARSLVIFITFLMTFPPVYLGMCEGITHTDPELVEMARMFHVPFLRRIRGIDLPRILPCLRTAVSVASGLCWKAGTAAEVIGLPRDSLGEQLYHAKVYFLTADLFAWTVVIILLSACFERLMLWGLDRLAAWCDRW